MNSRRIDANLIFLLTTTLVTLITWVGFEVYRAFTKSTVPEVLEKHLIPFEPQLDMEVFTELEKRTAP